MNDLDQQPASITFHMRADVFSLNLQEWAHFQVTHIAYNTTTIEHCSSSKDQKQWRPKTQPSSNSPSNKPQTTLKVEATPTHVQIYDAILDYHNGPRNIHLGKRDLHPLPSTPLTVPKTSAPAPAK